MNEALFDTDHLIDRDPHYFSNGTEHEMWSRYWCEGCVKDHCTHNADPAYEDGCPCIAVAMAHLPVEGWVVDNRYVRDPVMRVRCTFYEPCKCKDGVWKR